MAGSIDGLVIFIPIHRPSDVIGGNLLGLAVLCALRGLLRAPPPTESAPTPAAEWWRGPLMLRRAGRVELVGPIVVMSRLAHRSDLLIRAYGLGSPLPLLIVVVSAAAALAALERCWSRRPRLRTPVPAGGP